jgi:hypothetical protein
MATRSSAFANRDDIDFGLFLHWTPHMSWRAGFNMPKCEWGR